MLEAYGALVALLAIKHSSTALQSLCHPVLSPSVLKYLLHFIPEVTASQYCQIPPIPGEGCVQGKVRKTNPFYQRSALERRSHRAAPANQTAPICCSEGNMPAQTFLLHPDPSAPALILPPE